VGAESLTRARRVCGRALRAPARALTFVFSHRVGGKNHCNRQRLIDGGVGGEGVSDD
jgi:hypothetical protein